MSAELNKQSFRPFLAMSVLQVLLAPQDQGQLQAWRVGNQLLISEPALNEKLQAAKSPAPAGVGTPVELSRTLGLISHCERFVLIHHAQPSVQFCWVPLVTIDIDELGVGQILGDLPTWTLREAQDHPYMAMANLLGREPLHPQKNPWCLGVLFSSKALLPSTQVLIATHYSVSSQGKHV